MENTLREWAKAYREGPKRYRFPSDPDAEFFPVDMEDAAAEIVRLRKALKPFADAITKAEDRQPHDAGFRLDDCRAQLTLYEFGNARRALQQTAPEKSNG